MSSLNEFFECISIFPDLRFLSDDKIRLMYKKYETLCSCRRIEAIDFIKYNFYLKDESEWGNYITRLEYSDLCKKYNDADSEKHISDKNLFIEKYKEFLGRDVLHVREGVKDDFLKMCKTYPVLFIKPVNGSYGSGIKESSTNNPEMLWEELRGGEYLVEEVVKQHDCFDRLYPHSVNTIRVCVIISESGVPYLFDAVLRCGRDGAITDNNTGIFARIKKGTGNVCLPAMTHLGETFREHPNTGICFGDISIPLWKELCSVVLQVASVESALRIMNWDFALRNDGKWILIEGNVHGGFGIFQEVSGKGLRDKLMDLLEGKRTG